jgi:hypothetical protein
MSTLRDVETGEQQGSVLSPKWYSININDKPQTPRAYLGIFAVTPVHMRKIGKRVMFSEGCSKVSMLLRRGASAGT